MTGDLQEPVVESPAVLLLQRFLADAHPKREGFGVSGALKVVGLLERRKRGSEAMRRAMRRMRGGWVEIPFDTRGEFG